MKTRIIARHDIARIVRAVGLDRLIDEMIDRIEVAAREYDETRTVVMPRSGFHYTEPDVGLLEWMPVLHTAEVTTIKVVGYHPSNPVARRLPTILSTVSAYETETGHLAGLADGTFLTALRTGAASAVASRILAHPDSRVLGLVGCGAQSITQLHGIVRSFDIERVLIHDIAPENTESFASRAASVLPSGVTVKPAPLDLIVQSVDILCTSTSIGIDEGPLFDDLATRPWLHVNAVGSDFPGKVELPIALLRRSLVCPDHREQAMKEGECQQLSADEVGPSLAELVANAEEYRAARERTTVFDSTGWALEDRVGIQLLLDHANELGLGLLLELEDIGDDPLNPYHFDREIEEPAVTVLAGEAGGGAHEHSVGDSTTQARGGA